ncbi:MAG TPA: transcriptional activator NhaR [Verrucomicrobiales bacterium]|nr:transcriptional activator NhaR [Verrucomicrobiales bacterium]
MEWLNYHHLLYFWTVAREGSLRAASEKLHVSQPSISAQIKVLEESLGERLFRREGRSRGLTETGRLVLGYADEIFTLGQELMSSIKGRGTDRMGRLHVGVVDSFPKLLTNQILQPVFAMKAHVQLICREGKLGDLLAQLVVHRLDVVLADEPATGLLKSRLFNHRLGESTVTLCAAPDLARVLRRSFPKSLHDAPALLPSSNSSFGRAVVRWFENTRVQPRVLAEFEDLALMKALAADGKGFIAVPTAAMEEVHAHYGFEVIGVAGRAREQFYAITAERRITHPAVNALTAAAETVLLNPFQPSRKRGK